MPKSLDPPARAIVDREMLMTLKTCGACGGRLLLGEPVVLACGAWEGPPRWIHEAEAVQDAGTGEFVERGCTEALGDTRL